MYCGSKAGIDLITQVLIEEINQKNDVRTNVFAVAPGVIDTHMQELIRTATKTEFSRIDKFVSMHKKHHLSSPKVAARKVLSFVLNSVPQRNGRVDVREFILT